MPSEFKFKNPVTGKSWSCPIHCHRCEFIRSNGARCKNRTCFGSPLCWIHNLKTYHVKSQTSTIPAAGRGLFARKDFGKGEWICPMLGENISTACARKRYFGYVTAPYTEEYENGRSIDCACSRGIGSLANALFHVEGKMKGKLKGRTAHNAYTIVRPRDKRGRPRQIWLRADKKIKNGDEIFLWYGKGDFKLENTHTTKKRRRKVADTRPCR